MYNRTYIINIGLSCHSSGGRRAAVARAEEFNFLAERIGAWLSDGIEPHAVGVAARSAALVHEAREALRVVSGTGQPSTFLPPRLTGAAGLAD